MWLYALWGCLGAAANCGVVFVEASRRVKGRPWERPVGPGGGVYVSSVCIELFVAAVATGALSTTTLVNSGIIAFGIGAGAPSIVKKSAQQALALLPADDAAASPDDRMSE